MVLEERVRCRDGPGIGCVSVLAAEYGTDDRDLATRGPHLRSVVDILQAGVFVKLEVDGGRRVREGKGSQEDNLSGRLPSAETVCHFVRAKPPHSQLSCSEAGSFLNLLAVHPSSIPTPYTMQALLL